MIIPRCIKDIKTIKKSITKVLENLFSENNNIKVLKKES